MRAEPHFVMFCGGLGGTPIEDAMAQALRASALDLIDEALSSGAYGGAIFVADDATASAVSSLLPPGVILDVDTAGSEFHFGRRLADVIRRYELERPVYSGCGLPLIKADELAAMAMALEGAESVVVANNYFSADIMGFVPGSAAFKVDLPDNDRILPRLLVQECGLENLSWPRTIANQFDIDTPVDTAVLSYSGGTGPRLQAVLALQAIDTSRLAEAARMFTDRDAVVLVAGRISTDVLHYLQSETASQTRLYSEERGMQAIGRDISGEARTLLGYHLQAVGATQFFAELAELGTAAFIDTRPIFAHMGLQPSRPDRFLSDAMRPDEISDPWVREFTAAALAARIPVVFGGQSLVTSSLQLLSEAAWREHDQLDLEYKPKGRANPK